MFEPIFKSTPPYLNKAGKNARQVQIRECFPQPLKERLDEGGEAGEGKRFRRSRFDLFFIENEEGRGWSTVRVIWREHAFSTAMVCRTLSSLAYWDSSLRALPALYNKEFRLGPGKRWQQQKGRGPCSCCARPLLSQWGSRFGIY